MRGKEEVQATRVGSAEVGGLLLTWRSGPESDTEAAPFPIFRPQACESYYRQGKVGMFFKQVPQPWCGLVPQEVPSRG